MNYENNFDERRISLRKIIISTESGSDLPLDLIKRHNIQVVPMHVIMDEQNYPDGSIPVTMVYDYYQQTKKYPPHRQQTQMNMKVSSAKLMKITRAVQ